MDCFSLGVEHILKVCFKKCCTWANQICEVKHRDGNLLFCPVIIETRSVYSCPDKKQSSKPIWFLMKIYPKVGDFWSYGGQELTKE